MGDTVSAWLEVVHERYPPSDAADWDHPGLQVGDPDAPVARVLITLDVTSAVLDEAARVPATLVLAHHPLLLRPLHAVTTTTAAGSLALGAARAGVAVAAVHTNLDVTDDGAGTSDPVVAVLDLQDVVPLCPPVAPGARAMGRVGDLVASMTLRDVAERIARDLPAPSARLCGDPTRRVRRVAVLGGSGMSAVADALAAGADVLVTGDVRHHDALDALELGLAVIDAGHHATEVAAMPTFAARVATAGAARGLAAPVILSDVSTIPWESV